MLDTRLHNAIESFLKQNSNNNIINIKSFSKNAFVMYGDPNGYDIGETRVFFKKDNITSRIRLIIECNCKDSGYFDGIQNLQNKVYATFKPFLIGIDEIVLHYNFSTFYCKE